MTLQNGDQILKRHKNQSQKGDDVSTKLCFAYGGRNLDPDGRATNVQLYCVQYEHMHAALSQKYPVLVNREEEILQQNNTPLIVHGQVRKKYRNWKVLS